MGNRSIPEIQKEKAEKARSSEKAYEEIKVSRQQIFEHYMAEILRTRDLGEEVDAHGLRLLAESAMMQDGYCPPSMTGWSDCQTCGVMPNYAGCNGEKVLACPWCHTSFGVKKIIEQTTKELEDYEKFGSAEYRGWRERNPDIAARHDIEEMSDS